MPSSGKLLLSSVVALLPSVFVLLLSMPPKEKQATPFAVGVSRKSMLPLEESRVLPNLTEVDS